MIDMTLSLYIMQLIDQIFINMAIIIVRNENNFRVKKKKKAILKYLGTLTTGKKGFSFFQRDQFNLNTCIQIWAQGDKKAFISFDYFHKL